MFADGSYVFDLDRVNDAAGMLEALLKVRVLLARYMRTSPAEVDAMPSRERDRYLALLANVIKAESSLSSKVEDG